MILDYDPNVEDDDVEALLESTPKEHHVALLKRYRRDPHIGYWHSDGQPRLPDPRDFVDPAWGADEQASVVAHLRNGQIKLSWMGSSPCRLCSTTVGSSCLTDGVYTWPEGFDHYLTTHHVRVPQRFVDHVTHFQDRSEPKVRSHDV